MKSITSFLRTAGPVIAGTVLLSTLHADVVLEWNAALTDYAETPSGSRLSPFAAARACAMTHVVMAKVLSAAPDGTTLDVDAAMAQAAHDVMLAIGPDARDRFDACLAAQLALRPNDSARERGIAFGGEQARVFLHGRAYDLDPADQDDATAAARAMPFVLSRDKPLRAPVPDAPSMIAEDLRFAGSRELEPLLRRPEAAARREVARFWSEDPTAIWNRAARDLAIRHGLSQQENARLFALLNVALADAHIMAIESRAHYNSVREESRILHDNGSSDMLVEGGDYLVPPTIATVRLARLPNYPAIPATMSGAAAQVLADFFKTDALPFTLSNAPLKRGELSVVTRNYERFSVAAKECAIAGLCGGIDYREACIAGYIQGRIIGKAVVRAARFPARRTATSGSRAK